MSRESIAEMVAKALRRIGLLLAVLAVAFYGRSAVAMMLVGAVAFAAGVFIERRRV